MKFLVLPKIKYKHNNSVWGHGRFYGRDTFIYWAETYFEITNNQKEYYKITGLLVFNKKITEIKTNLLINL